MRKAMVVTNCAVAALLITLSTATAACLYLMATTSETGVKKTALFGSVFFEAIENTNGTTSIGAGVANLVPLAMITVLLTGFIYLVYGFYRGLRGYRNSLIDGSQQG